MTRSMITSIVLLLALHFVALGGVIGWLGATDRLSEERARRVVEMFTLTVEEEAQREAEREAREQAERDKAREAARLEAVAEGPQTLQDRLAAEQRADDLAMHRVERLQRETEDLRQQIERAKKLINDQKQQLQDDRERFEQTVEERNERRASEQFQQTVQMYEQLRPDQAKRMFQQLLNQGETDLVVDYLAEMQLRTASKILQEFETPQEIEQATTLLEQLRKRGVYPLGGQATGNAQEDDRT
ncbi:MAG: hypothetical protein ACODAQ_00205 [Phycisphaeraceae bacterium]